MGFVTNTFVDKTMFDKDPIVTLNDIVFYQQLLRGNKYSKEVLLNYNEVELMDSYVLLFEEYQAVEHNFLSVEKVSDVNLRTINPSAFYFQYQFRLSTRVIEYERIIYSFTDMAGDVGGFKEFIEVILCFLIGSYANRLYFAELIQKMFRVRLDTDTSQNKIKS